MVNKAVVFELNDKGGFYSVFFFLIQSYIYAKKNKYDFFIRHTNWYYMYETGWHDYFTSLNLFSEDYKEKYSEIIYCAHVTIPNIPNYTLNEYIIAIKEIYVLKPILLEKSNNIIQTQINDPYFHAIFIRRGDKISCKEAKYIEVSDILACINLPASCKNLFVQTDDCRVIDEIKKILGPKNIIVHSTVFDNKFGSYSKIWNNYSSEERKKQTEEMLIGLQICLQACSIYTDFTSNVGRFLKLSNYDKVKFYMHNKKLALDKPVRNPAWGFYL